MRSPNFHWFRLRSDDKPPRVDLRLMSTNLMDSGQSNGLRLTPMAASTDKDLQHNGRGQTNLPLQTNLSNAKAVDALRPVKTQPNPSLVPKLWLKTGDRQRRLDSKSLQPR